MAKALVTYCDVCLVDDDSFTEGRPMPAIAATERSKPRRVDLCPDHEKQYVTPYLELLARLGSTSDHAPVEVAAQASDARPMTSKDDACPICHEVVRRGSLLGHFKGKHPGESLARELLTAGRISEIYECTARGCDEAFTTRQGRNMHEVRVHGKRVSKA